MAYQINGMRVSNEVHSAGRRWRYLEYANAPVHVRGLYCSMIPVEDGDEAKAVAEAELIMERYE